MRRERGRGREGQRPEALREIEPRSFFLPLLFSRFFSLAPVPCPVHPSPSRARAFFFFLSVSFLLAAAAAADAQPVLHRRIDPIECLGRTRLALVHGSWISLHLPRTTGVIVRLPDPQGFCSRRDRRAAFHPRRT